MLPPVSCVYQIVNIADRTKHYLGSTSDLSRREREHRTELNRGDHHNAHLQRAWNKYGEEAFETAPLLICPVDHLLYWEQILLGSLSPYYNIAVDAVAPTRGRTLSADHRRRIGDANRRRVWSDQSRERLSNSQREYYADRPGTFIGRKHTEETKAKMRAAWVGRVLPPRTPEHSANISAALTQRYKELKDNV